MSKIVENSRPVSIPDFVTEDEDGWFGDWTDRMDEILLQLTFETQGDWNSISKKINEEVANMNINEDMTINWIDCIVRLICLPIIRSASTTKSQNGNLGFPRNSSTQQNLLLSSQIARQGVKALGYDQAQKVVVGALNLLNEVIFPYYSVLFYYNLFTIFIFIFLPEIRTFLIVSLFHFSFSYFCLFK